MKQSSEKATRTWVLILMSVAAFMVALDALVVSTALSTIRIHLGATIEELEWTVNAYTLSFAVLLLTGAALGDRFGRRRLFVIGLGIFVAASASCGLAPNIDVLIAARAVQGCGAALVMPLAITQLGVAFPPELRARALGIFSGVAGLAVLAGPVVGGALTGGLAWQWIFWLNVPIGLLIIPLVLSRVSESFGPRTTLDIGGMLLAMGAILGLVWGLVRGNQAGWGSLEVMSAIGAGLLLTVAFIVWEKRASAPMLSMELFRSRAFSMGNLSGNLYFASLYGATFFMAQFLQTEMGYGPLAAGIHLLPWTAGLFVSAPLAGLLISRLGERTLMLGALLAQAIAFAWIALIARPGMAYPELIAPLILASFASANIPAAQNIVINSVATHEIGKASGAFNMLRQVGAAFGVAILTAIFAGFGSFHSVQTFNSGFTAAMGVSAALSLLGGIAAIMLPGKAGQAAGKVKAEPEITEDEVYSLPG